MSTLKQISVILYLAYIVSSDDVMNSINNFGLEMLKFAEPDENVMISPFSICTAVAMLNAGAAGNTKKEIDDAFGWSGIENVPLEYKNLLASINDATDDAFILNSNNKLYVDLTFEPLESYSNSLADNFGASVEPVNFMQGDNSATVALINNWVEDKTNGKIRDMFSSLSNELKALLINTIYFKATWRFPFLSITSEEFYLDKDYAVKTDTMHIQERLEYYTNSDLELVKFPYNDKNSRLNFVVIKPKNRAGLSDLEKKVNYQYSEIQSWIGATEYKYLNVSMPKFEFESKLKNVAEILANNFHVHDAFSPSRADFSGISDTANLFVSFIIHQSFISVDEEGTEAAAATAIGIELTSVMEPEEATRVLINQPFMFLIYDEENDLILFSGRMMIPDQSVVSAKYLNPVFTGTAESACFCWSLIIALLLIHSYF